MTQPIRIPDKAMVKLGFGDEDVKNLSEIARFLESCETTGMNSRFWQVVSLLGRAKEMTQRMTQIIKSLENMAYEREDVLSICMADEESRVREAEENGDFHSVILLNRMRKFFNMKPVPALEKPTEESNSD